MPASELKPLNFMKWIEEHRHFLKPPVGNAVVWKDSELMIMVVGGPNQRTDYHIDPGEEFFYQIEGDMILKVVENGHHRDIPIREGEIFLLPPLIPHSPQRLADTVGLVIERTRRPEEIDHLLWYCPACSQVLFDETFHLTDITKQLKPVFDKFYGDKTLRTCKKCGTVADVPVALKK